MSPVLETTERQRASFADAAEIDAFVSQLERFERGEIGADEWRRFRLVRGTYGQRQDADAQMIRAKIPQGVLSASQLEALGDVAARHSRGFAHVTTRQNVQLHFVRLHDVEAVQRRLAEAGLTTREACGNAVRNITACPFAGVAPDEAFDVTPYAEALTRHLLRHPLSAALPRKFKIGFEACPTDHALTGINDLGFRGYRATDGTLRFRVSVGGGTSILCRPGWRLDDALPAGDLLRLAEAVIRVYHRLGDYQHRQRNRLKFLIGSMGFPAFREAVAEERVRVAEEGGLGLSFDPNRPPEECAPDWKRGPAPSLGSAARRVADAEMRGPGLTPKDLAQTRAEASGFERWCASNATTQKQPGYSLVTVRLVLGDVTSGQLGVLADLSRAHGDGAARLTHGQNLVLRWVPTRELRGLHAQLVAAGLARADAGSVADVTSCPGAETCRLAVTQSRGLARVLTDFLEERPDLVAAVPDLALKISGCPNGCGQHHVAGIGFQGSLRRLEGRALPQYFVMLGGDASADEARFARLVAKLPARRIPLALERLIGLYQREAGPTETATAFFGRVSKDQARAVLADLERLEPGEAGPADYVDLGDDHDFEVVALEGECSV